jgi:hypothetical protein
MISPGRIAVAAVLVVIFSGSVGLTTAAGSHGQTHGTAIVGAPAQVVPNTLTTKTETAGTTTGTSSSCLLPLCAVTPTFNCYLCPTITVTDQTTTTTPDVVATATDTATAFSTDLITETEPSVVVSVITETDTSVTATEVFVPTVTVTFTTTTTTATRTCPDTGCTE